MPDRDTVERIRRLREIVARIQDPASRYYWERILDVRENPIKLPPRDPTPEEFREAMKRAHEKRRARRKALGLPDETWDQQSPQDEAEDSS